MWWRGKFINLEDKSTPSWYEIKLLKSFFNRVIYLQWLFKSLTTPPLFAFMLYFKSSSLGIKGPKILERLILNIKLINIDIKQNNEKTNER